MVGNRRGAKVEGEMIQQKYLLIDREVWLGFEVEVGSSIDNEWKTLLVFLRCFEFYGV